VKTLFAGAGLALTAGLLLGAAMKPDLAGDDRPAGPQIFAGWSGARSTGPFDDGVSLARYAGQVPDYVLGTDWRKLASAQAPAAAEPPAARSPQEDPPLPPEPAEPPLRASDLTPAVYGAAPAERVLYPSLDGAAAYADESRAEMTPAAAAAPVDLDRDAPPEATGDTTPAR
jgi:hypothetical protein